MTTATGTRAVIEEVRVEGERTIIEGTEKTSRVAFSKEERPLSPRKNIDGSRQDNSRTNKK